MTQALLPLLKKSPAARIVNISSGMGGIKEMDGGWPGYRLSKAALNALTKVTAAETQDSNIKVNSVCPGWVRTDMGGPNATRSVEEAIPGILWAAELDDDGPTGGFFRDGQAIEW
jgi:NAD(P)-dependent dehydrogenase (short-subunit alcohol dehydrogenase family)